ncbi:hypothetical protein AMTRI_Chr12g268930 [Amborella trichopoda]
MCQLNQLRSHHLCQYIIHWSSPFRLCHSPGLANSSCTTNPGVSCPLPSPNDAYHTISSSQSISTRQPQLLNRLI